MGAWFKLLSFSVRVEREGDRGGGVGGEMEAQVESTVVRHNSALETCARTVPSSSATQWKLTSCVVKVERCVERNPRTSSRIDV